MNPCRGVKTVQFGPTGFWVEGNDEIKVDWREEPDAHTHLPSLSLSLLFRVHHPPDILNGLG